MKAINTYIIEKLVLNKDNIKDFSKGHVKYTDDKVCCLSFYSVDNKNVNYSYDHIELMIYEPYILIKHDDKHIEYKNPSNGNIIVQAAFENEHGYLQSNTKDYRKTVYINYDDMKDFLILLLKEKAFRPDVDNSKIIDALINNYFEGAEEFDLENKTIDYEYIEHNCVNHMTRPKDLKEFIALYYHE